MLSLPWQIPSFPQLPCDGCLPGTPKHCRGAQQFSGWTHPAWLAPGFSAAAGWPDCTGTPAPLEYWSCTESSSSSSGPGVIERLTHHVYNSKWNLHKSENKNNAGQIGLKALIRQQHQAYYSISFGFLLKNYTLWNIFPYGEILFGVLHVREELHTLQEYRIMCKHSMPIVLQILVSIRNVLRFHTVLFSFIHIMWENSHFVVLLLSVFHRSL